MLSKQRKALSKLENIHIPLHVDFNIVSFFKLKTFCVLLYLYFVYIVPTILINSTEYPYKFKLILNSNYSSFRMSRDLFRISIRIDGHY